MHAYCWRCPHSRLWIFVISPILGLLLLHHLLKPHIRARSPRLDGETQTMLGHNDSGPSSCHQLHGMDDVLVIMKTGVTEALEKVPVHLQTTLRCVPHYAIFSDFEEQISGVRTHDVLRNVSHEIKQTNPDFGIYNRVRVYGRKGLQESDLVKDVNSPSGKLKNPGWKLDKWKFLPMIDEALQIRPDAKWYYFMEADTYPFWPNLMAWLEQFDPEKPLYIGSQMQIGDVVFAYGGSGIILSNPAMRKASERRAARLAEIDEYTAGHWAGDCVLGKVLHDAGVNLLWAWPMMQTSTIWRVDLINEAYDKKPWCYPAVSFHHMTPADVELVWQFDQRWFREVSTLYHPNVNHVYPNMLTHGSRSNSLCSCTAMHLGSLYKSTFKLPVTTGTTSLKTVEKNNPPSPLPIVKRAVRTTQNACNTHTSQASV